MRNERGVDCVFRTQDFGFCHWVWLVQEADVPVGGRTKATVLPGAEEGEHLESQMT